jgi:hypothetical protein
MIGEKLLSQYSPALLDESNILTTFLFSRYGHVAQPDPITV